MPCLGLLMPWSAMQQPCLSYISEFDCRITHLPGSENVVADALSRPKPEVSRSSCSTSTFKSSPSHVVSTVAAVLQYSCPKVQSLCCSSALTVVSVPFSGSKLWCDTSTGILTTLDNTSRWLEAVTVKSITVSECAGALLRYWIPLFGIPSVITSD